MVFQSSNYSFRQLNSHKHQIGFAIICKGGKVSTSGFETCCFISVLCTTLHNFLNSNKLLLVTTRCKNHNNTGQ